MPNDDAPSEAAVEDQLRQAHQALSDAKGARDAELSDTVVVNRLYYACFHAAQAVLYDREHDPTTHGGVLSLFGSEIVKEGNAARADGRFLNDLFDEFWTAGESIEEVHIRSGMADVTNATLRQLGQPPTGLGRFTKQ